MAEPLDTQAWLAALAPLLEIAVDESDRDTVLAHLRVAARMAELLDTVDLPDTLDAAPVFRP